MQNESARMRLPDLHQHAAPEDAPQASALPDASEPPADSRAGSLWRENGKVFYRDVSGGEAVAVRVVWARPLSDRGGAASILQAGKKREIAYLASLDELDPASRRIAEEELSASMVMPAITKISSVRQRFGNYYWEVETDKGPKSFLLTSPETNSFWPKPDTVVIRDVSGNCYEIPSVEGLDKDSRTEMERVL
jgi:hypothetical protein